MNSVLLKFFRPVLVAVSLLICSTLAVNYKGIELRPATSHRSERQWSYAGSYRPHGQWGHSSAPLSFRPPLQPAPQPWITFVSARPYFQPSTTTAASSTLDRIGFDNVKFMTNIVSTESRHTVNSVCKDGGRVYKEGDKWTPQDKCARLSCGKNGIVSVLECPRMEVKENCLPEADDLRRPWPLCCAVPACDR